VKALIFAVFLGFIHLVVWGSTPAHAADRPLVLVAAERPDVRMTRAESELRAAGLDTRRYLAPVGERLDPNALRTQADETGVSAVLAIVDAGIEVWLRSKLDQGLVFVELVRNPQPAATGSSEDLALVRVAGDELPHVVCDERHFPGWHAQRPNDGGARLPAKRLKLLVGDLPKPIAQRNLIDHGPKPRRAVGERTVEIEYGEIVTVHRNRSARRRPVAATANAGEGNQLCLVPFTEPLERAPLFRRASTYLS